MYISSSSCRAARTDFPDSLAKSLCYPSIPVGLPGHTLCPYRAVEDKFKLVFQHSRVRVKRSIGERNILVRPCSSSSVSHILLVKIGWISR